MFKVGDKVRVREDLKEGKINKRVYVCSDMVNFAGKKVTIKSCEMRTYFYIEEDNSKYCWTDEMFEEIKEDNNMKELTFREVIANIKEGETYKNTKESYGIQYIYMSNGDVILKRTDGFRTDMTVLDDKMRFVKEREEYTFQEALEALIEGYEIESKINGYKYKKDEEYILKTDKKDRVVGNYREVGEIFSLQESINLWYIND